MLLIYFIALLFGFCCGSFLNCVIYRLEKKKSFIRGRSFCPKCKHILAWYDLIPIFSFLVLQGKCRYCKKKISIQYPLVELATGLLFLLIFNGSPMLTTYGFQIFKLFYLLVIACLLEIIFIYDLKHYIIPDKIVYSAIAIVFLGHLFGISNLGFRIFENLKMPFVAAITAGIFFFLIWLVSRGKWMGFGDVKLAFLMGLILGFPNILVALFLAFFLGAIIGLGLIFSGRKTLKSEIPFGPFLITGTFIGLFCGGQIINWYLSFLI